MIVLFFIAHYITIFRGMSSILWKKILRVGDPKSHESQLDRGTFHRISGADGNATAHLNLQLIRQDLTEQCAKPCVVQFTDWLTGSQVQNDLYRIHIRPGGSWALFK